MTQRLETLLTRVRAVAREMSHAQCPHDRVSLWQRHSALMGELKAEVAAVTKIHAGVPNALPMRFHAVSAPRMGG